MLFRLPQPLHGWREFVHEVIIVVIGVLLAPARRLPRRHTLT